ncbi:hypothetical protein [Catenovulum sediminis]|jgi:hypothetical protein|uniref:hypothetical protein n=1 Tax=Catenovulum sediminis TaxID=1740262 RepID=UPI001180BC8E|nr:hypothetical protein [Catenovulum sediminis]
MSKVAIIILMFISSLVRAGDTNPCNERVIKIYTDYHDDLKAGRETAVHWDIKGFVSIMKENDIPSHEHAERVTEYIQNYDALQIGVEELVAVWSQCSAQSIRGIIEIVPPNQEITGRYIALSISSKGKIRNISFEETVSGFGIHLKNLSPLPSGQDLITRQ